MIVSAVPASESVRFWPRSHATMTVRKIKARLAELRDAQNRLTRQRDGAASELRDVLLEPAGLARDEREEAVRRRRDEAAVALSRIAEEIPVLEAALPSAAALREAEARARKLEKDARDAYDAGNEPIARVVAAIDALDAALVAAVPVIEAANASIGPLERFAEEFDLKVAAPPYDNPDWLKRARSYIEHQRRAVAEIASKR